jgi:hypothetical protein
VQFQTIFNNRRQDKNAYITTLMIHPKDELKKPKEIREDLKLNEKRGRSIQVFLLDFWVKR